MAYLFSIVLLAFSGLAVSENEFTEAIPMQHQAVESVLELTDKEKKWLAKHKTIRIAYDGSLPPYSFVNDQGKIDGIAVEIMSVLSRRLGINFSIYPDSNWGSLYRAAVKRKTDIVATMVKRPDRTDSFAFTKPYLTKSLVIVTKSDNTAITSRESMADKKIAVVKGYKYGEQLGKEFPNAERVKAETMLESLKLVEQAKVDAAVIFLGTANYLQAKHQLSQLKIVAFFERNNANESVAVRKDWPELVSILQKGLDSLTEEEVQKIFAKWVVQGGIQVAAEPVPVDTQPVATPVAPPETKQIVEIEQQLPDFDIKESDLELTPEMIEIGKMTGVFVIVLTLFGLWLSLIRKQKKLRLKTKNEVLLSSRNLHSAENEVMHLTIEPSFENSDKAAPQPELLSEAPVADINIDTRPFSVEPQYEEIVDEIIHYQRDVDGQFSFISPSVVSQLGYAEGDFMVNYRNYLTDNPINRYLDTYIEDCIQGKPIKSYEIEIVDAGEGIRRLEVTDSPVYDGQGHCIGIKGVMRDISAQMLYDKVATKPTEPVFQGFDSPASVSQPEDLPRQLESTIRWADKTGSTFVLIFLTLDRLRFLDGNLLSSPDKDVLREAGKRLQATLRDTDDVAELESNKYAVLLPDTDGQTANLIVEKIRKILQVPYLVGVQTFVLDASMGIAVYPEDGIEPGALLSKAQILTSTVTVEPIRPPVPKESKTQEDGSLQLQQDVMFALDECKVALRASSPHNINALQRHSQFYVYYQSRHNLTDYSINGYEALIRWQHPQHGLLRPSEFVTLVKDIGLLDVMTYWIIQQVCLQAMAWEAIDIRPKLMAINLGDMTIKQAVDVSKIIKIVSETGAKTEWLEFSVPENDVANHPDLLIPIINHLVEAGFGVAIDNFASGSNVLNLLNTLPVKNVELDPADFHYFQGSTEDAEKISACITSLHGLGKTVVAKEIETERQLEFLHGTGCDVIQGNLLSRPLPAKEAKELMENLPDFAWYWKQNESIKDS